MVKRSSNAESDKTAVSPLSQLVPVKPFGQAQEYALLGSFVHVPPFLHGSPEHGSATIQV